MTLRDTFARGFVWKLAGLLALAAVGWLGGVGKVHAQGAPTCSPTDKCTREVAMQKCETFIDNAVANGYRREWFTCVDDLGADPNIMVDGGAAGFGVPARYFYQPKTCATSDPPLTDGWIHGDASSDVTVPISVCSDGCRYDQPNRPVIVACVDGDCWSKVAGWTAGGATCSASDGTLGDGPASDADKDGTSDANDASPNNPGKDGQGKDGKADKDTDGENSSGGGGNCSTPPNSSGDAIGAQIAYQAWATRCAIENAKDGNGNLKTTQGTGTGTGTGGSGTGEQGNGSCAQGAVNAAICAIKDYTKKASDFFDGLTEHSGDLDTEEGEVEEPSKVWMEAPSEADLDASGFGWGSSCPAPPEYMGHSLDAGGNLCMLASLIGAFVLLGAYAQAAYIIGRA